MKQLARLAVNAVALLVTVVAVPGLDWHHQGNLLNIALLALLFGVINTYLKPVLKLLSLPLRLITFGIFGLVINTGLFLLLAWVGDQFRLGFQISGWPAGAFSLQVIGTAVIGAVVLSIVSTLLAFIVRD
jgi:putative membrane protein